jgi:hypothetical protein
MGSQVCEQCQIVNDGSGLPGVVAKLLPSYSAKTVIPVKFVERHKRFASEPGRASFRLPVCGNADVRSDFDWHCEF